MATAAAGTPNVQTARVIDPRIEPQPEPVYAVTVGPKQNQFYKIPQSGLSDSYVTFNNLTTLGAGRAYLDTFELEIEAEITFHVGTSAMHGTGPAPDYNSWTFDSFPFNKCCDEIRANINGGAFFSQPLSYIRAKERYWNEKKINESYGNICPCNRPMLQNESGLIQSPAHLYETWLPRMTKAYTYDEEPLAAEKIIEGAAVPTRTGSGVHYYNPSPSGMCGSWNGQIIPKYSRVTSGDKVITCKWREPIFCSPFSSRIDETYGRPLYNITSIDITFNMMNLGNMIRVTDPRIPSYEIHLKNVNLCYQVMTVDPTIAPSYTVIPYRRYVPYVTDCVENPIPDNDEVSISMTSGVYTLNEVPTAIWVFAAPTKATLQTNQVDGYTMGAATANSYASNKQFGFMTHISISMANTTQILNTASQEDLYRIAKANGCQDSFQDWSVVWPLIPKPLTVQEENTGIHWPFCGGPGSVLRLIPGTDIIIPDQDLIPGANANNMVFQVTADFSFNRPPANMRNWALWVLFEYVGVATITPGQCQISMNPLGNGKTATVTAPIVSTSETAEPSEATGSGWLDKLKGVLGFANNLAKKTGIIGTALGMIPGVGSTLQTAARTLGYGKKRGRYEDVEGGAVMGLGDFI